MDGIGFVIVAVGVFAMAEIVANLGEHGERSVFTSKVGSLFPSKDDIKRSIGPIIRGTAIGAFFGVLPGTGPAIASFSSYMVEKRSPGIRRGSAAARSREWRDPSPPTTRTRSASSSDAHAGDSRERGDGADARRADDPRHRARPDGDDQKPDLFWGLIVSM